MPFLDQVTQFINDTLKAGSLNNKKLQPAKYFGLTTTIARSKGSKAKLELLPAVVTANGGVNIMIPESKTALQIYHKLLTNVYSYEKKSYGDGHDIKCISDLLMVVFVNSKLTGIAPSAVEPVVLFGIPQKLSPALFADLKISRCLIVPVASNTDPVQVFRQEFPQSDYFLNEQLSMFQVRYKIEMVFSQACVEKCLCD